MSTVPYSDYSRAKRSDFIDKDASVIGKITVISLLILIRVIVIKKCESSESNTVFIDKVLVGKIFLGNIVCLIIQKYLNICLSY